MARIVSETGMSPAYLEDSNNWISFDYFCRLLRKLVETTGDERAPFDAALWHTDRSSYRGVGLFLIHMGTPGMAYRLVADYHHLWNTISGCRLDGIQRQQLCNECLLSKTQTGQEQLPGSSGVAGCDPSRVWASLRNHHGGTVRLRWRGFVRLRDTLGRQACTSLGFEWRPCRSARRGLVGVLVGWSTEIAFATLMFPLVGYFMGREIDYRIRLGNVYRQNEEQAASLVESIRAIER